jgi:hypothetical protein
MVVVIAHDGDLLKIYHLEAYTKSAAGRSSAGRTARAGKSGSRMSGRLEVGQRSHGVMIAEPVTGHLSVCLQHGTGAKCVHEPMIRKAAANGGQPNVTTL